MRAPLVLLVAALLVLGKVPGAAAHGDGPSHYLEATSLYPSFAPEPSQAVELELMGYVDAAKRAGYPVRVGIANEGDVTDRPEMLKQPQRYAERVARVIGAARLEAPVLIVTQHGLGVAGMHEREGVRREVTPGIARSLVRGIEVPPDASSDDMARAAMAGVRQIAEAGGHPLPARVRPVKVTLPAAVGAEGAGGGVASWLPFAAPFALMLAAVLFFKIRTRISPTLNQRRESR